MKFKLQGTRRVFGLLLFVVAIGVVLRLPGYDSRAFWVDELWRINLILEKGALSRYWTSPNLYTAITAPLYLAVNGLLGWIDTSPWCLRLSSLLPSLVSIVLSFLIARKSGAGLGWSTAAAALFAVNVKFIHYSNEFKPYMFEVMVHLTCMYGWLDLVVSNSSRLRKWIIFSITLLLASFCSANIVFVLPAMALSLTDKVISDNQGELKRVLGVFFVIGCVVIGLYFFVWSYGSDKGLTRYWADGFYDPTRGGYLAFAGGHLLSMWKGAFSAVGARLGMLLVSVLGLAIALYECWKRHHFKVQPVRALLIFSLALLFTVLLLNIVGIWPIGNIRPNLFLLAIIAVLWIAILSMALRPRAQLLMTGLVAVVMVAGVVKTTRTYLARLGPPIEHSDRVWAAFFTSGLAGKAIVGQCKDHSVIVFLNPAMSYAHHYYANFSSNEKISNVLSTPCVILKPVPDAYANAEGLRTHIASEASSAEFMWYAYSHLNNDEVNYLKVVAREFGSIQSGESFEGAGYFSLLVHKPEK